MDWLRNKLEVLEKALRESIVGKSPGAAAAQTEMGVDSPEKRSSGLDTPAECTDWPRLRQLRGDLDIQLTRIACRNALELLASDLDTASEYRPPSRRGKGAAVSPEAAPKSPLRPRPDVAPHHTPEQDMLQPSKDAPDAIPKPSPRVVAQPRQKIDISPTIIGALADATVSDLTIAPGSAER